MTLTPGRCFVTSSREPVGLRDGVAPVRKAPAYGTVTVAARRTGRCPPANTENRSTGGTVPGNPTRMVVTAGLGASRAGSSSQVKRMMLATIRTTTATPKHNQRHTRDSALGSRLCLTTPSPKAEHDDEDDEKDAGVGQNHRSPTDSADGACLLSLGRPGW